MSMAWQIVLEQYAAALRDYVANPAEADLERAYMLSRQMVGDDRAMLDLVATYHRELSTQVQAAHSAGEAARIVRLAQSFFSESLAPFALAQRGFRDTIARLRDLNLLLEFHRAIVAGAEVADVVAAVLMYSHRPLHAASSVLFLARDDGTWERYTVGCVDVQHGAVDSSTGRSLPTIDSHVVPAESPEHEILARTLQAAEPIVLDDTPPAFDGTAEHRRYAQLAVPLRDADRVLGVLTIQSDAASPRRPFDPTELALAQLIAGYTAQALGRARLLAEVQQQNSALEAANRHKSAFLATMSHELRTPLNAIIGFAELMHEGLVGPVSAEHREYLGDILTSARHLLMVINDILDLAKVEAGKIAFRPEPIDLLVLIGEVADVVRGLAAAKLIRLDTEIAPQLNGMVADPARLKQVLYNYLSNAIKFTPNHGRVALRVLPAEGHQIRFEVEDTGIGIQPQDLERLFVEFQQLDGGAARGYQGTGLGLAVTKRIVEAQGGQVGVSSTPGRGSLFFAIFPTRSA